MRLSFLLSKSYLIVALVFSSITLVVGQSPEIPVEGIPHWQERSILLYTNMVRSDPKGFRERYLPSHAILENYPEAAPVIWNPGLGSAARHHAESMANSPGCKFSHSSCDGGSYSDRIKSFYSGTLQGYGENIAAGNADPFKSFMQWIRDDVNGVPAKDLTENAGHRTNIMKTGFREMGAGYGNGPNGYKHFWVQDFGTPPKSVTLSSHPLTAGTHAHLATGEVQFLVHVFVSPGIQVKSLKILLDKEVQPLTLWLGAPGNGTYAFTAKSTSGCRSYAMEMEDESGKKWRYPSQGSFLTYGEGDCRVNYSAASPGTSNLFFRPEGIRNQRHGEFIPMSRDAMGRRQSYSAGSKWVAQF